MVTFQVSVYPILSSVPSTAEGPDGVALNHDCVEILEIPTFDWAPLHGAKAVKVVGSALTRMGWLAFVVLLVEIFPS